MSGLPVLLFLDISGGELLVIMLVVFLVFGPEKMPEMARKAGRFMNQMKKASNDLTREFKKETSSLQSEFNNVQSKVKEEVESVSREINRTKAQVVSDLKVETNPSETPDKENPAPETPVTIQPVSDLVQPANNTIKSE